MGVTYRSGTTSGSSCTTSASELGSGAEPELDSVCVDEAPSSAGDGEDEDRVATDDARSP